MRTNYEIEIRRENGDTNTIPMCSTRHQANKAVLALAYALNKSGVKELILWAICSDTTKVKAQRIGYECGVKTA